MAPPEPPTEVVGSIHEQIDLIRVRGFLETDGFLVELNGIEPSTS